MLAAVGVVMGAIEKRQKIPMVRIAEFNKPIISQDIRADASGKFEWGIGGVNEGYYYAVKWTEIPRALKRIIGINEKKDSLIQLT